MKRLHLARVVTGALFIMAAAVGLIAQMKVANPFAAYEGTYRLSTGETILVSRVGVIEEVARPYFLDWQTGRYGYLQAKEADRFVSSGTPVAKPDAPIQTEIIFDRDAGGSVNGLVIRESGLVERKAIRVVLYEDREMTFVNGEVWLAATFRRPKGDGPFPAVVLVHGSGPGERTQLSLMNSFFAGLGLAVLTYDKRGCGASGGDWKKVDLDVLAQDALAGVRWLRAQPGIDSSRVGLWGISQGGWITPLAGSLDADVSFVMNSSGPATSLRRQDTFNMANTLKYSGFTEEEIGLVMKGLNLLYDYGQGKASAEALDALMDQARSHPKLKDLAMPPAKDISVEAMYTRQKIGDPAWYFHMNPDNDGLAPYERLRCPVLVTYGRLDYSVPVEESVKLLADLAAKSGQKNLTVKVIPDSGHGYLLIQEKAPMNPIVTMTISRAYFAAIESWLKENRIIGN
jgi:uncharacterized protein